MRQPLKGTLTEYGAADGTAEAYSVDPGAHAPAVIVLHEVWGLRPHIKKVCADLAGRGFAAFAPVLFWRERELFARENLRDAMAAVWDIPLAERYHPKRLRSAFARAKAPRETRRLLSTLYSRSFRELLIDDVVALTHEASKGRPGPAVVGYSMGGGLAFRLAAKTRGISACVAFSAEPPSSAVLAGVSSPLLALYGSEDKFMTAHVPRFVADSVRLGKALTLTIYPSAGHEFFARGDPGYEPVAAADSREAMMRFLAERLR
jgi:carboxymethylenebutenolidase